MTRRRSRYASDEQVRRTAKLAAEMGIKPCGLRLGGDGSVLIVDTGALHALSSDRNDPDAALANFESTLEPARRS